MTADRSRQRATLTGLGAGFLTAVKIRNYKSIAACDVELAQLTVLVGRKRRGKKQLPRRVALPRGGLETSIEFALRSRRAGLRPFGGTARGIPTTSVSSSSSDRVRTSGRGWVRDRGRPAARLRPSARDAASPGTLRPATRVTHYDVVEGVVVRSNPAQLPAATADRLFLLAASSMPEFRPAYDALRAMGFYQPES